nr:MAG TPA: hypothetical protein [Bacteriophage sp.]
MISLLDSQLKLLGNRKSKISRVFGRLLILIEKLSMIMMLKIEIEKLHTILRNIKFGIQ